MLEPRASDDKYLYGIVIDAGSSGSRLYVYKWLNSKYIQESEAELFRSVPQIVSNKNWNKKITPGLSSFAQKISSDVKKSSKQKEKVQSAIWGEHLSPLVDFAKSIIPEPQFKKTPIFVQATAGMRLLTKKQQNMILSSVCTSLKKNTEFLITNCDQQVQIIDGETEGIYGWISLNYLSKKFNNFNVDDEVHSSLGFMDMGGASTQISFVPSNASEIARHADDLSTVNLRSNNGDLQKYNVFVSTWLGFGANQARKRFLKNLVSLYGNESDDDSEDEDEDEDVENHNKGAKKANRKKARVLNDPCSPKGLDSTAEINGKSYTIKGMGDYDLCLKEQYPLLLKNLPCEDDPCLFNGVHVPQIDFSKDQFVGISEYWYTINDIFQLGGTYNFREFNKNLKEFCESDWNSEIISNYNDNKYNGIKLEYLKDSCFKGSWVVNILHEGFSLPRLDFENPTDDKFKFKSAAQIDGNELTWTLGRILLYASSKIGKDPKTLKNDYSSVVGILPSETDRNLYNKEFIPGNYELITKSKIQNFKDMSKNEKIEKVNSLFLFMVLFTVFIFGTLYIVSLKFGIGKLTSSVVNAWPKLAKLVYYLKHLHKMAAMHVNGLLKRRPRETGNPFDYDISLEEGLMSHESKGGLKSNNVSYLNFNFGKPASTHGLYENTNANNSAASLYSISSSKVNSSHTNLNNNFEESANQLRSRVSLYNLSNLNNSTANNSSGLLNVYQSPRRVNSNSNLAAKEDKKSDV